MEFLVGVQGGILLLLVLAVLALIYGMMAQRRFIHLDEISENALSQIGVSQEARWNALQELAKNSRSYAQREMELFESFAEKRRFQGGSRSEEFREKESTLKEGLSRLLAVAEAYPELKSSTLYQTTMAAVESHEKEVMTAKMIYNDTVSQWNRMVRRFPSNLVAKIFGFSSRAYLETPKEQTEYPNLNY